MPTRPPALALLLAAALAASAADAHKPAPPTAGPGDAALAEYFRRETAALATASLADVRTPADWDARKPESRRRLAEMLGLDPAPPRTDLHAVVTGRIDHPELTVENLHFQSRPGLYVTANLYIPKHLDKPAPTVLYVCGHGTVKEDNVAYGAKVAYQRWGPYLARAGYVCLIIDTLQLGEIEGLHHGTYRENMWWWHDRGYTPAGVEAWNAIRALDYLETRPEVDKTRFGVTGRSGGGAYSWWLATLDDRVKVAVPTAGITDLQNHVVDGCVEGHCDCMFMVNTYRWDYPQVAALVAPRPLLLENTDRDPIFPLDGVYRIRQKTSLIYDLSNGAAKKFGLTITPGPHKDTQDLQVPALRWFNLHLRGEDAPVRHVAEPLFKPQQLKVFKDLPADQINTKIHETFVPAAPPPAVPRDKAEWDATTRAWLTALREKSFRGWPTDAEKSQLRPTGSETAQGVTLSTYDYTSQHDVDLRLYVLHREKLDAPDLLVLNVLDQAGWEQFVAETAGAFPKLAPAAPAANADAFDSTRKMLRANNWVMAYLAPRGVGPTEYTRDEKKRTQILRRYYLLGQTLDGMQVWDARRAIQGIRSLPTFAKTPLWLQGERAAAGVALYASLFEPDVARLDLHDLPRSHRDGPHVLNVLKTLDLPAAVAMAASRSRVVLYQDQAGWDFPRAVGQALGWPDKQVQFRPPPPK